MARRSPQTERLVEVIEYLAARPRIPHSLADLARQLGVDKATCYPMLVELTRLGWLLKDPANKTYRLGPRLSQIGHAATLSVDAVTVAKPFMVDLAETTGCVCCLILPSGEDLVIADISAPTQRKGPAIVDLVAGDRIAFCPPLGSVLVAWSDDRTVDTWLERAPETVVDHDHYRNTLEVISRRGYAVECSPVRAATLWSEARAAGSGLYGADRTASLVQQQKVTLTSDTLVGDIDDSRAYRALSINAPVTDATRAAIGAISVLDAGSSVTGAELRSTGETVCSVAAAISRALSA